MAAYGEIPMAAVTLLTERASRPLAESPRNAREAGTARSGAPGAHLDLIGAPRSGHRARPGPGLQALSDPSRVPP